MDRFWSGAKLMPEQMILAGGIPSSGSTLLSSLLDGHADVSCGPETSLYCEPSLWDLDPSALARQLSGESTRLIPWGVPDESVLQYYGWNTEKIIDFARSSESFNDLFSRMYDENSSARVVVDKTPQNLYAIHSFLSNDDSRKAIVTIRSPDAVIDSLRRRGVDPRIAASIWVFDASIIAGLKRRYTHDQLFVLRYEDLVLSPDQTLSSLCQFIDISEDVEGMRRFDHSKRGEQDVSLHANGSNAASSWRNSPLAEISAASIKPEQAIDVILSGIVTDGVVVEGALTPFTSDGQDIQGKNLLKAFRYTNLTISKSEEKALPRILESDGLLSRFERFYLGKVNIRSPGPTLQLAMQRRITLLFRKALSGLIRLVMLMDRMIKTGLMLIVRLCGFLLSVPTRVSRLSSAIVSLPEKLWRRLLRLSQLPKQSLYSISRHASRYAMSGFLSRYAQKVETRRDNFIGARRAKSLELEETLLNPFATYARVPLPEDDYDVVGVVAFQGRNEILSVVVQEAMRVNELGLKCGLVLACSEDADINFANSMREKYQRIGIVMTENLPLGRKWQRAVDCAREAQPDFLFITGSDDVLSRKFVANNIDLMRRKEVGEIALSGPRSWYILDLLEAQQENSEHCDLWKISYHNDFHRMPLGAGRIYSASFLQIVDWQIFELTWDKLLDDKGYNLVVENNAALYDTTFDDGLVISVKGSWSQMNPLKAILEADSVTSSPVDAKTRATIIEELDDTWLEILSITEPQRELM